MELIITEPELKEIVQKHLADKGYKIESLIAAIDTSPLGSQPSRQQPQYANLLRRQPGKSPMRFDPHQSIIHPNEEGMEVVLIAQVDHG